MQTFWVFKTLNSKRVVVYNIITSLTKNYFNKMINYLLILSNKIFWDMYKILFCCRCKINCLSKVARSSKLQLIIDLPSNCPALFAWTMKKYSGNRYEDIDITNFVSKAGRVYLFVWEISWFVKFLKWSLAKWSFTILSDNEQLEIFCQ